MSMWGKQNERDPRMEGAKPAPPQVMPTPMTAPAPAPSRPAAQSGTLGKSTRLRGEIYSEEELFIDGDMEGTIEVRNRLIIGPNGKVKATIKATDVVVRGSVQGNVDAIERIAIMNGASIVGDVKTAGIVIEDGAYFKGGIDILRPDVKKGNEKGHEKAHSVANGGAQ